METEKNVFDVEQRNQKIDEYIRRKGIIKKKFPDLTTAPQSIKAEYDALNSLIDSLQTSRREIWGQDISSDGYPIDKFVKEKYEDALSRYMLYSKENEEYITYEEQQTFEFPEIDIDSLRKEIQELKTTSETRIMKSKLVELRQQLLPESILTQLDLLTKELAQISASGKLVDEQSSDKSEQGINEESNTPARIDESKFAQIYGKAKGKIQEVFSKLKTWFQNKNQEKNSENRDSDSRDN